MPPRQTIRRKDQARREKPNRTIILKLLDALVNFLANSATIAVAAPQLAVMGRQALEWGQRLFK